MLSVEGGAWGRSQSVKDVKPVFIPPLLKPTSAGATLRRKISEDDDDASDSEKMVICEDESAGSYYYFYYYYYCYKICIAHKFKHARVGGAGVAGLENGLAGEGK